MRRISFALTTEQVRHGFQTGEILKDVTRRLGWKDLKPGTSLLACNKCQGLKPGEKAELLGVIKVVSVRFEPLQALLEKPHSYGFEEVRREGFAGLPVLPKFIMVPAIGTPPKFVRWFCANSKIYDAGEDRRLRQLTPADPITRIEFSYERQLAWQSPAAGQPPAGGMA